MAERVTERDRVICDYEGTSYRARFWAGQGREYEDLAERVALRKLLPAQGRRIMEIGAGFGRLADLYAGYDQVILLDYAKSGLREAQERLGRSARFLYVAADLYHLPFVPEVCDTVVMVRVLHHVADVPAALAQIAATVRNGGAFVLEYANKRHLKSIARYWLGKQRWSPFDARPFEFVDLNFDFHPAWVGQRLVEAGFATQTELAVSHFRAPLFKRLVPAAFLARLDGALQRVGAPWKLTPSVFVHAQKTGAGPLAAGLFRCPRCGGAELAPRPEALTCGLCGAMWAIDDGIYDFKMPIEPLTRTSRNPTRHIPSLDSCTTSKDLIG